jgi:hypothetical protein
MNMPVSEYMTIEDVKKRLLQIKKDADENDPEAAHLEEDGMMFAVLKAIANGATNAKELASEAIKSIDIDFPRWCA